MRMWIAFSLMLIFGVSAVATSLLLNLLWLLILGSVFSFISICFFLYASGCEIVCCISCDVTELLSMVEE